MGFQSLNIALAKAGVEIDATPATTPIATPAEPATCAGTTKAGALCRNRPVAGSDFCRLHQPVEAPAPAQTKLTKAQAQDALAALRAVIAAAKAERARRAATKKAAKAAALAAIERRRRVVAERDDLLRRVIDLGAAMADARDEFDRADAPLAQALDEARRLGDLVPAAVVEAAMAEADALRKEFNRAQAQRDTDLRRLQAQVRRIEESPGYRAHLDVLASLSRKGLEILARANEALNAKDFAAAEQLAVKALRGVFPEDIRDRAEKFIGVVRYRRDEAARRRAERAERKRRRRVGKWFARAREARRQGDFIVAVGKGQFAHLRPVKAGRRRKLVVVSALGFDAPAEYDRAPRGARRVAWKKGGK